MLRSNCVCALLLLLITLRPFAGQTTFATITGTITDSSGAVLPGATVIATHVGSNYRYTGVSNEAGGYTIPQLREGVYTLTISATGFKEAYIPQITLVSLDVRRIDQRMEVGSVDTRIEVSAQASLIETETARISDSKNSVQLRRSR